MCELIRETLFDMGEYNARIWLEDSLLSFEDIDDILEEVFS
jgi:hypothetical protein